MKKNLKNKLSSILKKIKSNGAIKKITNTRLFKKFYEIFYIFFNSLYKSILSFNKHDGMVNAGYLAFSLIFALFPFIIFFTIIIGFLGQTEIGTRFLEILRSIMPPDTVKTIMPVVDTIISGPKIGIISIASITLLWNASSIVQVMVDILNKAFRIKPSKPYFMTRLFSILKFLFLVFSIICSILITIVLPKVIGIFEAILHYESDFIEFNLTSGFRSLILNLLLFVFLAGLYFVIPSSNKKTTRKRNVLWGSALTLFLWNITFKILSYYIQKFAEFQIVYGSLAGIIATLYFFNIMSMILIFGAEFNFHVNYSIAHKKQNKTIFGTTN